MGEEFLSKSLLCLWLGRLLIDDASKQEPDDHVLQSLFFADRFLVELEQVNRPSASWRTNRG